jgi:VRR-NUC domain
MLFAIPNGGHRHPAVAGKLKAEGVRAGIPDMMLAVPRGRHHGLFIEHKAGTRKPGPIQNDRMQELMEQGYAVAVSYGCDKTVDIISNYLRGERA